MVDDHNPEIIESKPLNTEIETLAPEATADFSSVDGVSSESTFPHNPSETSGERTPSEDPASGQIAESLSAATDTFGAPEQDYDDSDFAAALANFDREQAVETAAAHSLTAEEAIVVGTIVKITDKHAVIDIGLKSEGLLPLDQIVNPDGTPKFAPGDSIEVVVEREESNGGGYAVSHEKALRHKVWDKLEEAANSKTPVKGMVVSRVKGGLTVDIGIKAFLPGSQIEVRPVRNLDGYVGTEIEVRVIKLNKKRGNVVISRKELLEEDQNAKKSVTLATLEEGAILTGTVKNLTDYGAFVDLGGLDGLLHITDMSWGRLTHPRDLVNVGDEIQVKVLKFDKDKQRVSLGFKQLTPDPWLDATERYPIGAQVRGRVLNLTDFGAFIEIEDGIDGLVHVSNLSWTKRIKHPSEVLKKGEKVRAIVLGVEPENRRLSLGVKQLQPDVWDTFFAQHRIGDVIKGKVLRTAQFGAFVEIADGVEGLCHVSEAVDDRGKPVELNVGDEHEFKIVKMNQEEKKVGLSIRAVGEEASRAEVELYKEASARDHSGSNKGKGGKGGQSQSSSSSSSSTTLGDLLNWKRAEREDSQE
jgi:small subunit ribosomal protein S1